MTRTATSAATAAAMPPIIFFVSLNGFFGGTEAPGMPASGYPLLPLGMPYPVYPVLPPGMPGPAYPVLPPGIPFPVYPLLLPGTPFPLYPLFPPAAPLPFPAFCPAAFCPAILCPAILCPAILCPASACPAAFCPSALSGCPLFCASGAPHCGQNSASSSTGDPHFLQYFISIPPFSPAPARVPA